MDIGVWDDEDHLGLGRPMRRVPGGVTRVSEALRVRTERRSLGTAIRMAYGG
jgi:hypothetical protein